MLDPTLNIVFQLGLPSYLLRDLMERVKHRATKLIRNISDLASYLMKNSLHAILGLQSLFCRRQRERFTKSLTRSVISKLVLAS